MLTNRRRGTNHAICKDISFAHRFCGSDLVAGLNEDKTLEEVIQGVIDGLDGHDYKEPECHISLGDYKL
ncbi:MAG: hypothetical protein LBU07_04965 [Coriobacteriales bacterium]|jgi:hypothetical protein|nr:hypothetical protein [Coriobacteriales bacterium]